jgi:hypothetical protein
MVGKHRSNNSGNDKAQLKAEKENQIYIFWNQEHDSRRTDSKKVIKTHIMESIVNKFRSYSHIRQRGTKYSKFSSMFAVRCYYCNHCI